MKIKPKLKNLERINNQLMRKHTEKLRQERTVMSRRIKSVLGRGTIEALGSCITGWEI